MTEKPTCLKCGRELEDSARSGRPRSWCSTGCRRAAEYELRRLSRRLQALEERASALRHSRDSGRRDWLGRTHAEALGDVEAEVREAEGRLRLLLDAGTKGLGE